MKVDMSTLAIRFYIFSLIVSVVVVGIIAYVVTVTALVSFLLGVIYMVLMGWYVDPIYIVIGTLVFVFLFLARIDNRFKKIEKLLKGVNDASQVTRQNSDHLRAIAYNTVPELVAEYQHTSQINVVVTDGRRLPTLDATEPLPAISVVEAGARVQYEQLQPAGFCSNCGTPTRQITGDLRSPSDRQWDYASRSNG